jgi:hypothetical protein
MDAKIITDILESALQYRYKGYLKLTGEQGTPPDYERLLLADRASVRRAATDILLARHGKSAPPRSLTVTLAVLKQGCPFWDATVEDERLSVRFDALLRAPGPLRLGDFHYIPVLFHPAKTSKGEIVGRM